VTSKELLDSLYDSLMWDERILTARERELLKGILQRAQANVLGLAVVMELADLGGRAALAPLPVHSLSRV